MKNQGVTNLIVDGTLVLSRQEGNDVEEVEVELKSSQPDSMGEACLEDGRDYFKEYECIAYFSGVVGANNPDFSGKVVLNVDYILKESSGIEVNDDIQVEAIPGGNWEIKEYPRFIPNDEDE